MMFAFSDTGRLSGRCSTSAKTLREEVVNSED
jgi:hypothetical protein